jgi:hypothetical protein
MLMLPGMSVVPASLGLVSFREALLLGVPLAILSTAWVVVERRALREVAIGMVAGAIATLAYDGVRLGLAALGLVHRPFRSIALYGEIICGTGLRSQLAGWAFHAWNGCAFGAFYAVAFAPSRLYKAIGWGLFLELALVATSPSLLGLTIRGEVFASSFVGHLAYGAGLHVLLRGRRQA